MVPLTDIRVLTPLIIGFALEQLALDELVRKYKEPIQKLHAKGQSLQTITETLWSWLSGEDQKVFTPQIGQIYHEPPEFDKIVQKWVKADNIISVRQEIKEMTKVRKRVLPEHIEPSTGWPKTYVSITLKNLSDVKIDYRYRDPDGNPTDEERIGSVEPHELPKLTKFLAHTAYNFKLKSGPTETPYIPRTFNDDGDLELSQYFN